MATNVMKFLSKALDHVSKSQGFDRVLSKVKVVEGKPGHCVCEMKVEEDHLNLGGTLHGGLTSTLIDSISTIALMSNEGAPPGVSVDLNVTFMKAAKAGDTIVIDSSTVKLGKTLAFLSVDVLNKETGDVLVHGRHTKYVAQR